MTALGWLQIAVLLVAVGLLTKPLGIYMARVYQGQPIWIDRALGPLERLLYRISGIDPKKDMGWKKYAISLLAFSLAGFLLLYLVQRIQGVFPSGPSGVGAIRPDLAFNTAVSFVTNTNWQAYAGETTMKYVTQMVGLTVQNFVSAATGMAVAVALIRGFSRKSTDKIGNFWADMVRSVIYILLPLSIVFAIILLSQGVVQTFHSTHQAALVQATTASDGTIVSTQSIAVGPAASQVAIKQLGTNGGGFFNANSSHPFENPTPLSNFVELLAILLVPAGLTYTFGRMVGNTRQGWAVFGVMMIVLVGMILAAYAFEARGVPQEAAAGADIHAVTSGQPAQPGGNMEGKETRFGLQRVGELHARFVHSPWRHGPAGAHRVGGGHLRGRRFGSLRDPGLRHHRGLHRRPHGGPNAGIPGQEGRGIRDEDGRSHHPHPGGRDPIRHCCGAVFSCGHLRDPQSGTARAERGPLRVLVGGGQ
jgi:K+-transporting ATPase ATPase A chain